MSKTNNLKCLSEAEYDKLATTLEDIIVRFSDHLIQQGIQENKFTLTNGFDVLFRDRKKKRE